MRVAARVFIIFGLLGAIGMCIFGVLFALAVSVPEVAEYIAEVGLPTWISAIGAGYIGIGAWALLWSILSLVACGKRSKAFQIVCGIFYLPISLLASIFMFCIKNVELPNPVK